MDVISYLSLTLGLGSMTLSGYGSLTDCIFHRPLSLLRHPSPLPLRQLPPLLLLLLGGIVVLDISLVPSSPLLLVVVF